MIEDRMVLRIRALLAKAEGASTEAEAEAYSEKAEELMAKYGIDLAMARDASSITEQRIQFQVDFTDLEYGHRKAALLRGIATAYGCYTVRHSDGWNSKKISFVNVFGFKGDIDLTLMLWRSLLVQAERALAQADIPVWEHKKAFRTSWWQGFSDRIYLRLLDIKKAAVTEAAVTDTGKSTALVLRDQAALTKEFAEKQYPGGLVMIHNRASQGSGRGQGRRAADRADLGTNSALGSQRRALK